MSYTAKSLEDIAKAFDHHAWQASAFSDRLHKTKRDKMLAERESQTWTRAAQVIRETTLEPTDFSKAEMLAIQNAVSNSDIEPEDFRQHLLDKIGART